jgi:hypothetical protein
MDGSQRCVERDIATWSPPGPPLEQASTPWPLKRSTNPGRKRLPRKRALDQSRESSAGPAPAHTPERCCWGPHMATPLPDESPGTVLIAFFGPPVDTLPIEKLY